MPQIFNEAVITDDGAALLNRAIGGECQIQITRMSLGSGTYTDAEKSAASLQQMTDLKVEEQTSELSSLSIETATSVKVKAAFSNENVATAYHINEIGLFAQEEGDSTTEVLYSIAVTAEDEGEIMPVSDGTTPVRIVQSWYVTVSNSSEVTLQLLSDDAFALAEDMGQLSDLNTTIKTSMVGAINEVFGITQNVANNLTTTVEGYVLDARQGKVLYDYATRKATSTLATSDFSADTTVTGYSYKASVSDANVTADTQIDGYISSGSFDGSFALETASGTINIYLDEAPAASLTFTLYLTNAHS